MTTTPDVRDPSRGRTPGRLADSRRRWLMLTVLLAGQFMALLDVTVVNVVMPTMRSGLGASGSQLQLVVAGYTVSYAMSLITGARLGDLFGRRRMFLAGLLVFTVSSLLCGLAPDATTLIVARFVQGAGAALMVPQIISVIQLRFTGDARATALSAYSAVIACGAIAGMVLGGVLVGADLFGASWRPVFLVNVPFGLIVAALVPRLVPPDGPRGRRRLDFAGLAVAVPAVFLVVLPLVLGHEQGWPAWTFAGIAAGLVLAVVFVGVERRVAARGGDPLLRLDVLTAPGMRSGVAAIATGMTAYGGFLFVFTLHLQGGLGDTPLRASLILAPAGVAFGLFGFYWRKLPRRIHPALTPIGFALAVGGYLLVGATLSDGTHGGLLLRAGLVMFGAGMGAAFSPLLTNALVHVPPSEAADASGVLTTTVQLGQAVGVAAFGSLFLTLAVRSGPHPSAGAVSTTLVWLAAVLTLGVLAAVILTRAVLRAGAGRPGVNLIDSRKCATLRPVPTATDFERMLRGVALRVTRPRVAVLAAVHGHPHADTDSIIGIVRADLGGVSHQAVYDVLRVLTTVGLLRRIEPPGSVARYEARVGDNHHHVVCRSCGAIADVDCAVGTAPCLTASDDHGFTIDEAEVVYRGLCPGCSTATSS